MMNSNEETESIKCPTCKASSSIQDWDDFTKDYVGRTMGIKILTIQKTYDKFGSNMVDEDIFFSCPSCSNDEVPSRNVYNQLHNKGLQNLIFKSVL